MNFNDVKIFASKIIIYPFAFTALPIVTSIIEVKKLVLPEEIIPCLILAETGTAILFAVSSLVLRSITKGAIATTATIGLFFSYRLIGYAIIAALTGLTGHAPATWLVLILYVLLSAACVISSLKKTWNLGKFSFEIDQANLSQGLNIVSVGLLILNSFSLFTFEVDEEKVTQKFVTQYKTAFDDIQVNDKAPKPDIYYFIVDGFASDLTMKEYYNTQQAPLFDFLRQRKFYVVPKARSNYDRTEFSLSSTFNMQNIDSIPAALGKNYDGLNIFCRMIQDSAVRRTFKRLGYTFVNVSSGNSATDWMYTADKNIRCVPFNHFVTAVALLTPLYATEEYFPITRNLLADMRLCPGNCLKEIVDIPGPKFVLIHTDLAHAPCLFDAQGNRTPLPMGQYMVNWGTPAQLSGQWLYAQSVLVNWLTQIMDMTGGKSVIVMQSDHGSGINMPKIDDWYNERMRILNALYLPGKDGKNCYETMTPVNNFRVLFNDYFDAKFPMLPDHSWCPPVYAKPFDWIDVRDKVRFKN